MFWWNPDSCHIACYVHAVRPCFDGAVFRRTRYAKAPVFPGFLSFPSKGRLFKFRWTCERYFFNIPSLVGLPRRKIQNPWLAIYFINWENVLKSLVKIKRHAKISINDLLINIFQLWKIWHRLRIIQIDKDTSFGYQSFVTKVANKMVEYKTIKTF